MPNPKIPTIFHFKKWKRKNKEKKWYGWNSIFSMQRTLFYSLFIFKTPPLLSITSHYLSIFFQTSLHPSSLNTYLKIKTNKRKIEKKCLAEAWLFSFSTNYFPLHKIRTSNISSLYTITNLFLLHFKSQHPSTSILQDMLLTTSNNKLLSIFSPPNLQTTPLTTADSHFRPPRNRSVSIPIVSHDWLIVFILFYFIFISHFFLFSLWCY